MHGDNKWIEPVKEYLECAGKVTVEENFFSARWSKLIINSAFSPLSAMTGITFGRVARDRYAKRLAIALMNEAFAVAEACGVEIAPMQGHDLKKIFKCNGGVKAFSARLILPFAMRSHRNLVSGMYADLNAGRKCDIEYVNGIIRRLGKKFGVSTPVTDAVVKLIHEIERGEKSISRENTKIIYEKVYKGTEK